MLYSLYTYLKELHLQFYTFSEDCKLYFILTNQSRGIKASSALIVQFIEGFLREKNLFTPLNTNFAMDII